MRLILLIVVVACYVQEGVSDLQKFSGSSDFSYPSDDNENAFHSPKNGLEAVIRGINDFSPKLFKTIAKNLSENLVCTPISLQIILSMAASGARGNTAKQLTEVLNISEDHDLTNIGFQTLLNNFNKIRHGVQLRFANKIFLADYIQPKREFTTLTRQYFDSEVMKLDFSKPNTAASAINNWVEFQTNYNIKDFINAGDVNPNTGLVLVNAVYFESRWKSQFYKELTRMRPFYVDGKTPKTIDTMAALTSHHYGELTEIGAKFVELEYEDEVDVEKPKYEDNADYIRMFIILPDARDGLPDVVSKIEDIDIGQLFGKPDREVLLYLPKFKIESEISFNAPLMDLGLSDWSNFTGISDYPLITSKIVQKAFINVNEEGTMAGAASGIGVEVKQAGSLKRANFDANHPFLVIIASKLYRVPLFIGQYTGKD